MMTFVVSIYNMVLRYRKAHNVRSQIGSKWRLPSDIVWDVKEDGDAWELRDLLHKLDELFSILVELKVLTKYLREDLGNEWIFPGDEDFGLLPNSKMDVRVLLKEIEDFFLLKAVLGMDE
jgi:hypothetical protein